MLKTTKYGASCLALLAAGALGLMLAASPASAQGDEYQGDDQYSDQSDDMAPADANGDASYDQDTSDQDAAYDQTASENESIEVTAPRPRLMPGDHAGGPLGKVYLSREVTFGDLDLRTRHGAHELMARIRDTARGVCSELDAAYPGAWGDSVSCVRDAVHSGMAQANDAISDARGYAYNESY